jgi:hypothetical protein
VSTVPPIRRQITLDVDPETAFAVFTERLGQWWPLAELSVYGAGATVAFDAGPEDVVHLVLHHRSGPSSVATVTQSGGEAARGFEGYIWGGSGQADVPVPADDPAVPLRIALTELADNARSGQTGHPCDVRFGRDVGRVLAAAQRQLDERAAW